MRLRKAYIYDNFYALIWDWEKLIWYLVINKYLNIMSTDFDEISLSMYISSNSAHNNKKEYKKTRSNATKSLINAFKNILSHLLFIQSFKIRNETTWLHWGPKWCEKWDDQLCVLKCIWKNNDLFLNCTKKG